MIPREYFDNRGKLILYIKYRIIVDNLSPTIKEVNIDIIQYNLSR